MIRKSPAVAALALVALLGASLVVASAQGRTPDSPDFDRNVAAVLASRCIDCHNAAEHKGKLDLTHRTSAMAGGKEGVDIIPGKLNESRLWHRVAENEMPPKHPLADAEKQILRRWIVSGAVWGTDPINPFRFTTDKRAGYDWWSLQPIKQVDVPVVGKSGWARNAIDNFVLAKLQEQQLAPSPEADRRTLIRRVTVDLTGLPPTPEQATAFVADDSPDAYARLVDRLLASPDYGVRWGRHWLDAIRFGESNGFERDQLRPNAWRFRDWVVDAFNNDMPYPQFARMQIAGDVLQPGSADGIISTGFLVCGAYDEVGANQQSLAMRAVVRQDELEDDVGAVSQTFLGLTANCARCHDHKFDPITQHEYYQLASALSGVKHGERDLPEEPILRQTSSVIERIDDRIARVRKALVEIESPVRRKLLADHKRRALPLPAKPIAEWQFDKDLLDHIGTLNVTLEAGAVLRNGALQLPGKGYGTTGPIPFDLKEKTLEAWVALGDLQQRGGGVIGVQSLDGGVFDSIVFGEREAARWMAGSNGFGRTESFNGSPETAGSKDYVHVAITYKHDGTVVAYRNGQPYGQFYRTKQPIHYSAGEAQITFGIRHFPVGNNKVLLGAIRKARLYDRALTADEVAASAGADVGISDADVLAELTEPQRTTCSQLQYELRALVRQRERAMVAKTYTCVPTAPPVTHLLYRGSTVREGPEVSPGGIGSIVGPSADFGLAPDTSDADRRLKLANWITDERNPLFGRVIVNRLWQYHFGAGIVETPNDLGFNGGRPSHPELLDWLAHELQTHDWSLKAMHRLVVMSATYRQSSLPRAGAMQQDASNRLLWRMNPRRIEAEALRDSVLQAAGELAPNLGGPGYEDYYTFTNNTTFYESRDYVGQTFNRRSLYRTWVRSGRNPLLDVFDCPDPSTKTPRRAVTTTPLQALALMDDPFVLRMSDTLAQTVEHETGSDIGNQIDRVYERTLCRQPTTDERDDAAHFIARHGLAAFCRVILNSSEFVTAD